jgi:hypothetical protein
MKFSSSVLLVGRVISGVSAHSHHHEAEAQKPLHEKDYVQDSVEELERKWNFQVSELLNPLSKSEGI